MITGKAFVFADPEEPAEQRIMRSVANYLR